MVRASLLVSCIALVACKKPAAEKHDAAPVIAKDAAVTVDTPPAPKPPVAKPAQWKAMPSAATASKVLQVEMEDRQACVRRADGQVRCWGSPTTHAIGTSVPVVITGAPEAAAIALAHGQLAVITRGGDLALGLISLPSQPHMELLSVGEALDVRIDTDRAYVLTRSGDVIPVRDNHTEERSTLNVVALGAREPGAVDALHRDGTVSVIVAGKNVEVKGITDAESLFGEHCAHRRSGAIACWNRSGKSVAWTGPTNIVDRLATKGTTCTLASSGLACSGANDVGQLGMGPGPDRSEPRIMRLTETPTAIAAGDRTWCALLDGSVMCWGANDGGQLGIGSLVDAATPTLVESAGTAEGLVGPTDSLEVGQSAQEMSWDGLPGECKRPTRIPSPSVLAGTSPLDAGVAVASAYALPRREAWEMWFANFRLEPAGYRPDYAVGRGSQLTIRYDLSKGKANKPTQPITRGRYQTITPKQFASVQMESEAHGMGADLVVELVTKDWICGTILGAAKAKYPFAARIQSPRFP
ncbi:MAG TPA: RCC1 domain-containing protein [Kofleriaceae bacterium]|jgi:hypothetical protein